MTKKSLSKLLSVILTLAICSATVFGCLITANATDVECYTWSDGDVTAELDSVTINLNLTAPAGYLAGGIYEAMFSVASENDALVLESIEVTGGTRVDGAAFSTEDYSADYIEETSMVDVYAASVADNASMLTLTLNFSFADGVAAKGAKYYASIANLEMSDGTDGTDGDGHYISYTGEAVKGVISTDCEHVFDVTGLEPVEVNTVEGYYVYENVPCANNCGEVNEYQLVPATELKNVLYWDGTTITEPTTTDSKGNILITSAAELAYITSKTVTGNYKVADGIDAFVLQTEEHAKILDLVGFEQTKAYFEGVQSPAVWKNSGKFKGTFDGNGVEIYGIVTAPNGNGGLFALAYQGTTIKNVIVKNSYIMSGDYAGVLVGRISAESDYLTAATTDKDNSEFNSSVVSTGVVSFDKVIISGCYLKVEHKNSNRVGILFGGITDKFIPINITNVLVHSNLGICTNNNVEAGLLGLMNGSWNGDKTPVAVANGQFKNIISIDAVPYMNEPTNQGTKREYYSNVYTNVTSEHNANSWYDMSEYYDKTNTDGTSRIVIIDKADAMGTRAEEKLSGFDWDTVWHADQNGGYPMLTNDVVSIGGSILYGRGEPDTVTGGKYSQGNYMTDLVAIKAGTASQEVIAQYGQGTEANPFIIYNSNHLRTIVQYFDASLKGSYFKVADGISAFVLQNKATTTLETILDTPESQLTTVLKDQWQNGTDTNTWANAVSFSGHIDFNGITIYGMYNLGGGLFQKVQGDVSFKNLTIKKSYVERNGWCGTLVAETSVIDKTTVGNEGSLTIENCSVVDCYTYAKNATSGAGAFVGYTGNGYQDTEDANGDGNTSEWVNGPIVIKNCFVKYNTGCFVATGVTGGVGGGSGTNNIKVSNCLVLGIKPYVTWSSWQGSYQHFIHADRFSNVYTDQSVAEGNLNGTVQNYTGKITQIAATSVEGLAAKDTLAGFDFDNVWSCDGNGGYPTPAAKAEISTQSQFILNLLAVNNSYNDDGTFNFNFYYAPTGGIAPVLYIGRADGNGFDKLIATEIGQEEAEQLGVEVGTLKYSIKTISSREIGDNFLATAVAKVGSTTAYGKTEAISPADYATAILQDANQSIEERQVAAALIGYGVNAKATLEAKAPTVAEKKVLYVSGGNINQTAPTKGTGTEADPFIIENAHHLRYIVQKSTPATTYGVYYKVDPTIDIMVFQTESYINSVAGSLDAFLALDAEGTKAALSNTTGRIQFQSGSAASNYDSFAGNIDFSGVTICGMYNQNGGLIAIANGGTTLKNLTLCNNYISSGWYNGNLVGYVHHGTASTTEYRPLTISNVVIHDCYQTTTGNGYGNTGVLVGTGVNSSKIPFYISNILTYDNTSLGQKSSSDTTMVNCALYGALPASWNGEGDGVQNAYYNNIVTLDCVPYPTQSINNQCTRPAFWNNVYTTMLDAENREPCSWNQDGDQWAQFDITKIDSADLALGGAAKENMPKLDWINVWYVNKNAYPTPITNGLEVELPGKTIYWNGTADATLNDNGEAGTATDPIIIDSAEELFQLTNKLGFAATVGKYYKVADDIDTMILQPEGKLDLIRLLSCANASEVAAYLTGLSGLSNWNLDSETWFDGNFDGNGVTIMGMYSNARSAGLFPTADGGAPDAYNEDNTGITIGNFTLKNSYVLANSGQNRAGAIVGGTPGPNYGNKVDGVINFEKCVVENCYVQGAGGEAASGVFLGVTGNEIVRINLCAVYGTEAYYTKSGELTPAPLCNGYNGRKARDESGAQISNQFIDNTVSNSIILGVRPYGLYWKERVSNARCLTNVYTDQSTSPYTNDTYTEANLKAVTADGLIGSGAADVVNALNTFANETVWHVGNSVDGMPGINKSSAVPTAFAADYANVKFESYNDYGTSTDQFGLYASSLTLTNNPYMSLNFAFGKEDGVDGINYKHNRDNITVDIKYDSDCDGVADTTITTTPPAYDGSYISDNNGWTNKKGAGKYHSFKLELPVYALASDIEVLITYDDGATTKTVSSTISVSGFGNELDTAYKILPCDYYSSRIEAVRSLLFYIEALQKKFK